MRQLAALGAVMASVILGAGCGSSPPASSTGGDTGTSIYALSVNQFANSQTFSVKQASCQLNTNIYVEKGDVVRAIATGVVNPIEGGGPFGPEGGPGLGGTSFVFVNRPEYALVACFADGATVLVGSDDVFTAPSSGEIGLGINGTSLEIMKEGVGGQFDVTIYTLPDVVIGTVPSILDNTRGPAQAVTVDAAAGWVSTGITLKRGQKTFLDASGTTVVGGQLFAPDGDTSSLAGTDFELINRSPYRLYGRVGTNIVDLGGAGVFLSPTAGELELSVNNGSGSSDQAVGTLVANVAVGVVPARDLTPEDLLGFTQHDTQTVLPNGQWSPANIHVDKGDPIFLQATGKVIIPSNGYNYDPFGAPGLGGTSAPLPSRPTEALFGGLGTQVLFLGGQAVVFAPTAAQLKLDINAYPSDGDTGEFTATIGAP
jgi:hypothetical protein